MTRSGEETIVEKAHAKVNLWLEVIGKRADGYHELETIMHEIDLADTVRVTAGGSSVELDVDVPGVGTGEDNLAVKAVRALERWTGRALPCRIELEKRIPAGGGLGGGSSDAAAVLRALDRAFGLELGTEVLERVGGTFGSDISFFVRGGTSRCTGRGEIIEPIAFAKRLWLALVLPAINVPTHAVFGRLRLTDAPRDDYALRRCLESGDVSGLKGNLFNRLELAAAQAFPKLREILDELAPEGAVVSGSGSTIFVLCDSREDAIRQAEHAGRATGVATLVTSSAAR